MEPPSIQRPFSYMPLPWLCIFLPRLAGLIFWTDKLTNDRYLVDTGATLSIVPCNQNSSPSGPLLKGADYLSPLAVSSKKLCNFKANFSHPLFCKPLWLVPFWALIFWENSKSLLFQRSTKYSLFALQWPRPPPFSLQQFCPPPFCFKWPRPPRHLFSSPPSPALVPIQLPTATTSSQPSAISVHVVRNPEEKSSSFSSRENQSLLDPPPAFQKIPDSVPADVTALLQKFPSILCTGDVKLTPTHRVEHHIHTSSHFLVFAKSRRLDPEKLQNAKAEFKRLESACIIHRSNHHGHPLCTWYPKKMDRGSLVAIIAI
jgi:hypothetical protein